MRAELLSTLRASGIELWADDGRLRYRAPAGVMTDVLMDQLRARKGELLSLLSPADIATISADPTELHACGAGVFYQLAPGGEWLCSFCVPRVGVPVTVFLLAGGIIPDEQPVGLVSPATTHRGGVTP